MMRYRDIIFDFDGTLSDTYPVFTEALLTVMDRHGIHDTYESVYSKLKVSVGTAIRTERSRPSSMKSMTRWLRSVRSRSNTPENC